MYKPTSLQLLEQKKKEKQLVFGIPSSNPTPTLKGSMITKISTPESRVESLRPPKQTVAQVVAKTPQETGKQSIVPRRPVGEKITSGTEEKQQLAKTREIPVVGKILAGTGKGKTGTYSEDTIAGQMERKGLVGFLFEGFIAKTDPSKAELGNRIYERYAKYKEEGVPEDRATEAAIQDVYNKTSPKASNLADLKNPNVKLTEEEENVLTWINAKENIFAVLDAPIFLGTTKGLSVAGKEAYKQSLGSLRDTVITRLEKEVVSDTPLIPGGDASRRVDILKDEPIKEEVETYLKTLKENESPSLRDLNSGLELLRLQGKEVDDIAEEMVRVTKEIFDEPKIVDEITGKSKVSKEEVDIVTKVGSDKAFKEIPEAKQTIDTLVVKETDVQLTEKAKQTLEAFARSTDQEILTTVDNIPVEIGSFGRNNVARKADKEDRFPIEELKETLDQAKVVLPASLKADTYRANNKVFLTETDEGLRAVYTRTNQKGVEEVINWHSIPTEKVSKYLENISIPDRTRTGIKSLEGSQFVQLAYGDNLTLSQQLDKINVGIKGEVAKRPAEALAGGITGYEENEEGDIEIDPTKAFLGMAAAGFLGLNLKKQQGVSDMRTNQANNLSQRSPESSVAPDLPGQPKALSETRIAEVGQSQYPLTSPSFSDSLSKEYAKVAGQSIDEATAGLSPSELNPENMGKFATFRDNFGKAWTKVVETIQDDMIRVRRLVEDPNIKVTDNSDPYLAELLFHGRIGTRITKAKEKFVAIDKDIVETSKNVGISGEDMTLLINKFLHARHTPERNLKLGDGASGLTDKEAKIILDNIDTLPYQAEVKRIAEEVQTMNNETLDVLLENQVIDQAAYDTMREVYKNHVPLNRILDTDADVSSGLTGKGFDVRGTGIMRAKGSDRQVADILANVVVNYEQALIRAEKNRVDLTTLQLVKDNPELGLFEIIQPKVVGRKFDRPGKSTLGLEDEAYLSDREIPPVMENDVNVLRDKVDDTWGSIYSEMDYATAGKRKNVVWEDASGVIEKITSTRSTFPKWVPEELRDKALFNKVLDLHSAGSIPRGNATREKALLDAMEGEMIKRLPLNLQEEVALSYLSKESETLASLYAKTESARGQLIFEQINDPRVLTLREKGKPVNILIKDEQLAMALKGVNRQYLPGVTKFIGVFTRFYSGLQTRFNPEFAFPNKIRDLQEAIVYAGSRGELGFKGGIKGALDQRAYLDVVDYMRGNESEGAKLYQQMLEDGGTTGGMGLSTREAITLDIEEIRRLNRSAPRQAADLFISKIDQFNTIFEDSTRLALYKQALKNGTSRKRAAQIAKEASVNFNKFGTGGPVLNALFMFANASIQGTTKMLRAMKNPKVAASVSAAVGSAVFAASEWNDKVDPDWRNKVTKWDRTNSLVLILPTTDEQGFDYVSIPVGWGIKPIKVGMDYLNDAMAGKLESWQDAANGIGVATINAYNPLGGSDIFSSVTPTILDIPLEIGRNKAWHGGVIMPDWDKNAPDHIRYFPSLSDNTTGKVAIQLSEGLSGLGVSISPAAIYYAYQGYVGGAGRTGTDVVNTIITAGKGEMPESNDIPVWSRFVKTRDNEEVGQASGEYEDIKKILEEQSVERFYLKQDAENSYRQLSSMEKEAAADLFDEIIKKDPELAKKINEIMEEEELGLTYTERLVKQLGVENGQRAKFVYNKLESLDSDEERAELWDEYVEKKIISKTVAGQLDELYDN